MNDDIYTCFTDDRYNGTAVAACSVAFMDHFRPRELVGAIAGANAAPGIPLSCVRKRCPTIEGEMTPALLGAALQHSVCAIVIRDPVAILVGGFYEWQYKITTNLTAPEYLRAHGPEAFVRTRNATNHMLYGHISQLALIERRFWPTVLESCIVGTTEDMDGFLKTRMSTGTKCSSTISFFRFFACNTGASQCPPASGTAAERASIEYREARLFNMATTATIMTWDPHVVHGSSRLHTEHRSG